MKRIGAFVLSLLPVAGISQEAIFLHHSTGGNVYYEGDVPEWISAYNAENGTSFQIAERAYPNTPYPWSNYPYDYWNLWVNQACDNADSDIECLDGLTQDYDLIIFKHCYPGAAVVPDDGAPLVNSEKRTLANYKLQYRALRDLMDSYPETKFIVWTLAPLHRLATTPEHAARAGEFVEWVKTGWLSEDGNAHPNIFVFDFFSLAAELESEPENGQTNCLKYEYEQDHEGTDSHPNLLANQTIGPIFAEFVVGVMGEQVDPDIPVSSIALTSAGGVTQIAEGTTLQMSATVLPPDATDRTVVWSVINGTGTATIDASGLLTAGSAGTVTARATAHDGSGVTGNISITIAMETILADSLDVYVTSIPEVTMGQTLQVYATIYPENATCQAVSWITREGTGAAGITQNGLLLPERPGLVDVIAIARDCSGLRDTLTVEVLPLKVNSVVIVQDGEMQVYLEDTIQFVALVSPSNATDPSVSWNVNANPDEARITSGGQFCATREGAYAVFVRSLDGSGAMDSCIVTVVRNTTNANKIDVPAFSLYPNPGQGVYYLEAMDESLDRVRIVSASGVLIMDAPLEGKGSMFSLDLSGFEPGMYHVQLFFGKISTFCTLIQTD